MTFDIQDLITSYLTNHNTASIDLITYQQQWLGTPTRLELRNQAEQWSIQIEIAKTSNNGQPNPLNNTPPKQVM